MKTPSFKPTASDTSTSATSLAINDEAALTTLTAPHAIVALKPRSASTRRQLLSRGAGLAASAALPLGIGSLSLAVPSEAQAINRPGTADGMWLLWAEEVSQGSDDGSIKKVRRRAISFKDNTFFSGIFEQVVYRAWPFTYRWNNFEIGSAAHMYYYPPDKQWRLNFTQKGKLEFSRKRDVLLNPDTCNEPWSKEDNDYQHRSLTMPGDTTPHTPAQIRQRRELGLLKAFSNWLNIEGPMNVNDQVMDRVNGYILEQRRSDRENGRSERTREEILAQRFNVDFRVATNLGNEPPSFFSATITDRHDPSQHPFYLDVVRWNDPTQLSNPVVNRRIHYRTLVTQVVNGRRIMPVVGRQPLTAQPTASIEATENRFNDNARRAISRIPDDEARAAFLNTLTQVSASATSPLTSFSLTPCLLAAMSMSPSNFPADRSVAHIGTVGQIVGANLVEYLVNSSLEIYNYFRGRNDRFDTDHMNGWRWYRTTYDENDPADRRLIGYTHDRKGKLPPETGGGGG